MLTFKPKLVHSCRLLSTPLEHLFIAGHQLHLKLIPAVRQLSQLSNDTQVDNAVNLIVVSFLIFGPPKLTRWYSNIVLRRT